MEDLAYVPSQGWDETVLPVCRVRGGTRLCCLCAESGVGRDVLRTETTNPCRDEGDNPRIAGDHRCESVMSHRGSSSGEGGDRGYCKQLFR
ncbi:hypothetical protein J6590_054779 [Homalodisca vitripennis]|nr:hypothetical protein J6590_054779 [Homalodisca vitripennis]